MLPQEKLRAGLPVRRMLEGSHSLLADGCQKELLAENHWLNAPRFESLMGKSYALGLVKRIGPPFSHGFPVNQGTNPCAMHAQAQTIVILCTIVCMLLVHTTSNQKIPKYHKKDVRMCESRAPGWNELGRALISHTRTEATRPRQSAGWTSRSSNRTLYRHPS